MNSFCGSHSLHQSPRHVVLTATLSTRHLTGAADAQASSSAGYDNDGIDFEPMSEGGRMAKVI